MTLNYLINALTIRFYAYIKGNNLKSNMSEFLQSIIDRDPAAKSKLSLTCPQFEFSNLHLNIVCEK